MIIIELKEGESVDRALKRYKRKQQRVGTTKELRSRKEYIKPSVRRRATKLKAKYRLKKFGGED
ncbi:MAG: 30S ribosomal protein S21 [Bacteroidota bacterium]